MHAQVRHRSFPSKDWAQLQEQHPFGLVSVGCVHAQASDTETFCLTIARSYPSLSVPHRGMFVCLMISFALQLRQQTALARPQSSQTKAPGRPPAAGH